MKLIYFFESKDYLYKVEEDVLHRLQKIPLLKRHDGRCAWVRWCPLVPLQVLAKMKFEGWVPCDDPDKSDTVSDDGGFELEMECG